MRSADSLSSAADISAAACSGRSSSTATRWPSVQPYLRRSLSHRPASPTATRSKKPSLAKAARPNTVVRNPASSCAGSSTIRGTSCRSPDRDSNGNENMSRTTRALARSSAAESCEGRTSQSLRTA